MLFVRLFKREIKISQQITKGEEKSLIGDANICFKEMKGKLKNLDDDDQEKKEIENKTDKEKEGGGGGEKRNGDKEKKKRENNEKV